MSDQTVPDDVRALVDAPNVAHIATVMPDGAPHCVPVWVGIEGERLAILTSPGSRKARNLERDPRVSISLSDAAQPNRMAHIRGRVCERVEGDRAWTIIDRMSQRYLGGPYPLREDRVVYLIDPEVAWGASF
jgi:PPOX class probable F420-dependent enzyme